jgi:hypothetical protein
MPGTDVGESVATVFGELPDLPHLPELPARGPGADLLGRTAALLVDLHVDRQPAGWRVVDRPGLDERRAASYLARDLDALEEAAQGWTGPLKVQVAGPWTLAAHLELPRGGKLLGDAGACRDLTESLTQAVTDHVADVARRVPGARVLLQLDEPSLPAVLAGHIRTPSGYDVLRAVDPPVAEGALREIVAAAASLRVAGTDAAGGVAVGVHCCAPQVPLELLIRAGATALLLDTGLLGPADDEAIGAAVEAGVVLGLGVVAAGAGDGESDGDGAEGRGGGAGLSDLAGTVQPLRRMWQRIGLAPDLLPAAVLLTPACGLAGASPEQARRALALCRGAAARIVEDPEG